LDFCVFETDGGIKESRLLFKVCDLMDKEGVLAFVPSVLGWGAGVVWMPTDGYQQTSNATIVICFGPRLSSWDTVYFIISTTETQ
jgi:hypothetical protein